MTTEHLDSEAEQIKEVYTRFGLAVYMANCLEHQLAITLASQYGPGPTRITGAEFDDLLERKLSKTMGQLVRELGELADMSDDEEQRWQQAVSNRNWLAHGYFRERATDIFCEAGRVTMIQELQEAADSFMALDHILTEGTMEWAEPMGINRPFANCWDELLVWVVSGSC